MTEEDRLRKLLFSHPLAPSKPQTREQQEEEEDEEMMEEGTRREGKAPIDPFASIDFECHISDSQEDRLLSSPFINDVLIIITDDDDDDEEPAPRVDLGLGFPNKGKSPLEQPPHALTPPPPPSAAESPPSQPRGRNALLDPRVRVSPVEYGDRRCCASPSQLPAAHRGGEPSQPAQKGGLLLRDHQSDPNAKITTSRKLPSSILSSPSEEGNTGTRSRAPQPSAHLPRVRVSPVEDGDRRCCASPSHLPAARQIGEPSQPSQKGSLLLLRDHQSDPNAKSTASRKLPSSLLSPPSEEGNTGTRSSAPQPSVQSPNADPLFPANLLDPGPANLLDVVMRYSGNPSRRFEDVDFLDIALMKGIDFPPPRWWRPGGYDAKKKDDGHA